MKHTRLTLTFLLFAAALRLVAQTATVSGHVTSFPTGAGLPNYPVWITGNDPATSVTVYTDANGDYTAQIDNAPEGTLLEISTIDSCYQAPVLQLVPVLNGGATADFALCFDNPWPDTTCMAFIGFWQQDPSAPLTVQFFADAYGGPGFEFTWDFGDGTSGTGQQVEHTYAQDGVYTITLTAVSPDCSASSTISINVPGFYTGPTVEVTVSGQVSYTNGQPASDWWVSAPGANPFTFYDTFTDANGYYEMVVEVPDTAGTVLVQTYDNCTGLLEVNAPIVNGGATANFTICFDSFPPFPDCQTYFWYSSNSPLTYSFSSQTYTPDPTDVVVTYFWDFGDGTTSAEANPTHTYGVDGVYTVSLTTTTASGCESYACDVVCTFGGGVIDTFYYGCQAMFGVSWGLDPSNPNGGFNSLEISFFDLSFGAVQSWSWDFGDGANSSEQNPVHTYAQAGLYTVALHIETLDGCESDISMEIYVGDFPWTEYDCQAMFFPIPDSTGNGFFFLDLSSSPGAIQSWSWDFGDGATSTEQNPFHTYTEPGVYTVTLSIVADSCNSTISFDLDTTDPFFRFGGNGGVLGLATGATDTKEVTAFEGARMYPNPASDEATLAFTSRESAAYELRVTDVSGQTVLRQQQEAAAGPNAVRVPLTDLKPGIYLVQLRSENQVQTLKLMKN